MIGLLFLAKIRRRETDTFLICVRERETEIFPYLHTWATTLTAVCYQGRCYLRPSGTLHSIVGVRSPVYQIEVLTSDNRKLRSKRKKRKRRSKRLRKRLRRRDKRRKSSRRSGRRTRGGLPQKTSARGDLLLVLGSAPAVRKPHVSRWATLEGSL